MFLNFIFTISGFAYFSMQLRNSGILFYFANLSMKHFCIFFQIFRKKKLRNCQKKEKLRTKLKKAKKKRRNFIFNLNFCFWIFFWHFVKLQEKIDLSWKILFFRNYEKVIFVKFIFRTSDMFLTKRWTFDKCRSANFFRHFLAGFGRDAFFWISIPKFYFLNFFSSKKFENLNDLFKWVTG